MLGLLTRRNVSLCALLIVPFFIVAYLFVDLSRLGLPSFSQPKEAPPPHWQWTETPSRFQPALSPDAPAADIDRDYCARFPTHLLSSIQVVFKTGISESAERVNASLASVNKCITNLILVGDGDYETGSRRVYDVLADLSPAYRANNKDFLFYEEQKAQLAAGSVEPSKNAWKLDKYKFFPMIERAYDGNPQAKWFVFIEGDTYIFWDNLFRLLDNLSPSEHWYIGSPSPGRRPDEESPRTMFAYGGTGFVLSSATVQKLVHREVGPNGEYTEPRLSDQFLKDIRMDCCGDSILGWALWKKGITISGLWPHFNPHSFHSVPYSKKMWCQPVITLHKTFPEEFPKLWQWEQTWNKSRPVLYADLIDHAFADITPTRADWTNAAADTFMAPDDSPAHQSFEECGLACQSRDQCFQYTYHARKCSFVRVIRRGREKFPDAKRDLQDERYLAGWDLEKINRWRRENPCDEPLWSMPSVTRIY